MRNNNSNSNFCSRFISIALLLAAACGTWTTWFGFWQLRCHSTPLATLYSPHSLVGSRQSADHLPISSAAHAAFVVNLPPAARKRNKRKVQIKLSKTKQNKTNETAKNRQSQLPSWGLTVTITVNSTVTVTVTVIVTVSLLLPQLLHFADNGTRFIALPQCFEYAQSVRPGEPYYNLLLHKA